MNPWKILKLPPGIELYYHAHGVEYVKDGDRSKPLSPSERRQCDEVVRLITQHASERRAACGSSS